MSADDGTAGAAGTIDLEEFFALVAAGQSRCGLCACHYGTDGTVCDEGRPEHSLHRVYNGFVGPIGPAPDALRDRPLHGVDEWRPSREGLLSKEVEDHG